MYVILNNNGLVYNGLKFDPVYTNGVVYDTMTEAELYIEENVQERMDKSPFFGQVLIITEQ